MCNKRVSSDEQKSNPKDRDAELVKKWMLEDNMTRLEVVEKKPRFANDQRYLLLDCESIVAERAKAMTVKKRTKVVAFQGEPGTGKSSTILNLVPKNDLFTVGPGNNNFFCGYSGHKVVAFEEICSSSLELNTFKTLAGSSPIGLKRKHRGDVPFEAELLVMITNHSFGDVWPKLKTNSSDLDAVRRRVDLWCKFTKGLAPYEGFSMIRFRYQDVETPTEPMVEWLGIFYPLEGGVTFANCVERAMRSGFTKGMVRVVRDWVALTMYIVRLSIQAHGILTPDTRKAIDITPESIKSLQLVYQATEDNRGHSYMSSNP